MLDMAILWLIGLVAVAGVTAKLDLTGSDINVVLQAQSGNDTGCSDDPHGDPLKELCDIQKGITCCLYRDATFLPGLLLDIEGGDDNFLRSLLPQLPADNITYLSIYGTTCASDTLCVLPNLQILDAYYTTLGEFTCLSQLRELKVRTDVFGITNTSFQGLNHLHYISLTADEIQPSGDELIQLQTVKELQAVVLEIHDLTELNIWPLCLAQTHPGITVSLLANPIAEFTNTLSPSECNIDTPLLANTDIDLTFNVITYVSDIADGWGFSSMHHFIMTLMRDNSTDFPIVLDDNPFSCDCRDLDLYRILRDPQYNVHLTNLAELTCYYPANLKGRQFYTLLDSELNCTSSTALLTPLIIQVGVPVGGTVLIAVAVFGFLYHSRIRLYRWSGHKLHPWDRDECIGEDKEFDVFVSHAAEDEEWTLGLIEDLKTHGFKVHFRNMYFEVGVTKIENIMMAVDKSKRMIRVLSPRSVANGEFDTVFSNDIKEHRRRLLLVVTGRNAMDSHKLAVERYKRDFTYIDADSPYFKDNLLYYLPVKRLGEARGGGESGVGRDCHADTSDSTSEAGPGAAGEHTPLPQDV